MLIKEIKRQSTENKISLRKARIIFGASICSIALIFLGGFNNSNTQHARVMDVDITYTLDNIRFGEDSFVINTETSNIRVIEEKIAENAHVIFSDEESVMYNLIDASIMVGPELDRYSVYKNIEMGTQLKVLGYNKFNVAKVLFDGKELYIDANLLTNNKDYIFENVDGVVYAKTNISAYVDFENKTETIEIKQGEELHLIGVNESPYSKVELNNETYYVDKYYISESESYVFEKDNKTMYTRGTVEIKETQDDDSEVFITLGAGMKITVIGTNDSNFAKVKIGNIEGYVHTFSLTNEKVDLYPYLTLSTKTNTSYNEENALDGIVSTVPESEQTEENVYLLAQLIHCEAGSQGYDGQRAVATVVVNRLYSGNWGDSIHSVIYANGQFSPVGSGKIEKTAPTEDDLEAARDVLIGGFRSFPAYVLYFQSHKDGYFAGHMTYMTTYYADGSHPQYFSYKAKDFEKYQK